MKIIDRNAEWNPKSVLDWMEYGDIFCGKPYPWPEEHKRLFEKRQETRKRRGAIFAMDQTEIDFDEYWKKWWDEHPHLIESIPEKTREEEERRERRWDYIKMPYIFFVKLPLFIIFGVMSSLLCNRKTADLVEGGTSQRSREKGGQCMT